MVLRYGDNVGPGRNRRVLLAHMKKKRQLLRSGAVDPAIRNGGCIRFAASQVLILWVKETGLCTIFCYFATQMHK